MELGSGLGLGGLAAAASWSLRRCLMTDTDEEALEELRSTVERNQSTGPGMCTIRKVDWNEYSNTTVIAEERSDILIATDVTYNPKLVGPFVGSQGPPRTRQRMYHAYRRTSQSKIPLGTLPLSTRRMR